MSIELHNIDKSFWDGRRQVSVLRNFSLTVRPGAKLAILGAPGSGKSTTMGLIASTVSCDSGKVVRGLRTSWVIPGYSFFSHYGTGVANVRFVARFFGMQEEAYLRKVMEMSDLGERINDKLDKLPSLLRGQLAITMGLCLETDVFLFDDSIGLGSPAFRQKCSDVIQALIDRGKAVVIAASTASIVTPFCDEAYVIEDGRAVHYGELTPGLTHLERLVKQANEREPGALASPAPVSVELHGDLPPDMI